MENPFYTAENPFYIVENPFYIVENSFYIVENPAYIVENPLATKCVCVCVCVCVGDSQYSKPCIKYWPIYIQPTEDTVAQHFEIISKNFQLSTRRTSILMGLIVYYLVLIVSPMGRILVRWKSFRNHLGMLCYPMFNWL